MAKNIKGTTPSGFKFEISERRLNNYELLELLGEVDEGNGQAFPKVLKLLFGEEQAKAFKDHLREEDGIVPTDKLAEELKSVFNTVKELKKILVLNQMIKLDEDALICDLAETYQIYSFRQLPLLQVAVFAYGLRDDSRIKQRLSGQIVPLETMLLAGMVDRLSLSLWIQTEDGQKGKNRPKSIFDKLIHKEDKDEREYLVFESGEDFEKYRKEFLAKVGGED